MSSYASLAAKYARPRRPRKLDAEDHAVLAACELERQRLLREAAQLTPDALAAKWGVSRWTVERAQRREGAR